MKNSLRYVASALGLAAVLPALRAAAENRPAPKEESKEMRVIVRTDGDAGQPGPRVERRVFLHRGGEPGEKEIVTFLGVGISPVSPTLTAQLGLPNGSGLVVGHIVPDSPAAAALKEHDILLKLDDQILVDARQLSVLVRNHKEGDEVTLSYLRGGKPATVRVKLAKHEVPKITAMFEQAFPGGEEDVFGFAGGGGSFELPQHPGASLHPGETTHEHMNRVLSLLGRAPDGGPTRIQIERRSGPGFRAMSVNPGNSNLVFSDDQGSLDLTIRDGAKTLVARNAQGEQVFSGPVTTPEERKAIPPDVRERREKLEGMHGVTFRTDGDFQGAETRIMRPAGRGISLPESQRAVRPPPVAY